MSIFAGRLRKWKTETTIRFINVEIETIIAAVPREW